MAHFRGTLTGSRATVSRLGGKSSGMRVEAQSWEGKVVTRLDHDEELGIDTATVSLEPHNGHGVSRIIFYGPVSGSPFKV